MALLVACPECSRLHARTETVCPFCGSATRGGRRGGLFAAVAVGLALVGCADDDGGRTTDDGVESDSAGEATYGVPMTDSDDDTTTGGFGETDAAGSTDAEASSSGTEASSTGTDGSTGDTDTSTGTGSAETSTGANDTDAGRGDTSG